MYAFLQKQCDRYYDTVLKKEKQPKKSPLPYLSHAHNKVLENSTAFTDYYHYYYYVPCVLSKH